MSMVQQYVAPLVPRTAWRNTAGRLWGGIMKRNHVWFIRQIPNFLSLIRPIAVFTGFLSCHAFLSGDMTRAWVLLVTTIAIFGLTDYLDGKSARSLKLETRVFGKIIDPITDKITAVGLLIIFLSLMLRPHFLTPDRATLTIDAIAPIICVELLLLATALIGLKMKWVPGSNQWGKHKLAVELVTIVVAFGALYSTHYGEPPKLAQISVGIMAIPAVALGVMSLIGHITPQLAARNNQ